MNTTPSFNFYKYHGTGNDFVLIDNRSGQYDFLKNPDKINIICHRRFGIGADGLILLEMAEGYDFKMAYYNADGNEGSMCGNGGRCIVSFAQKLGLIQNKAHFIASDGPHHAVVIAEDFIELQMQNIQEINIYSTHSTLNTGSPHYIMPVNDIQNFPVFKKGQAIRFSSDFPQGINVNFVEQSNDGSWDIRTYERGVEDETWACGTGATAAAIALVEMNKLFHLQQLTMKAKGGDLIIKFKRTGPGFYEDIWLCGNAQFVYQGIQNV